LLGAPGSRRLPSSRAAVVLPALLAGEEQHGAGDVWAQGGDEPRHHLTAAYGRRPG
jgi:hypothetical protein